MALVWAWQCQCQWQRPPPPWQVSRDPAWCGPGLRESKFSFDSDATGGRRSNQRAVAPNQPTTPVTHQAPQSTTSAFNFDCLFACFCLVVCCTFSPFVLFSSEKGTGRLSVLCTPLNLTLPTLREKERKRIFYSLFVGFLCVYCLSWYLLLLTLTTETIEKLFLLLHFVCLSFVCLFAFCFSLLVFPGLDLASCQCIGRGKQKRENPTFCYNCFIDFIFIFFVYLFDVVFSCFWYFLVLTLPAAEGGS